MQLGHNEFLSPLTASGKPIELRVSGPLIFNEPALGLPRVPDLVVRVGDFGPLSRLRERVGVRAGHTSNALKKGPHPALRATFSREREKRCRTPE